MTPNERAHATESAANFRPNPRRAAGATRALSRVTGRDLRGKAKGPPRGRGAPYDRTNRVYPREPPLLMNERNSLRASSIFGAPGRALRCKFIKYESKGDAGCMLRIVFKNLCNAISSIIPLDFVLGAG